MNTEIRYAEANVLLRAHQYAAAAAILSALAEGEDVANRQTYIGMRDDALMLERLYADLPAAPSATVDDVPALAPLRAGTPNVVFFHIDFAGKHPFLGGDDVNYRGVLAAACGAALKASPGAAITILTNTATDWAWIDDAQVQIVRLSLDPAQMMYGRVRAYRALALSRQLTGPTLFLDTDVVLVRDFMPLFDGTFDIGLTYRHQTHYFHMPYNEGMILVRDVAGTAAAQFFDEVAGTYDWLAQHPVTTARYGFDVRRWRGGQLSLAALMKWKVPASGVEDSIHRGVRYRLLPCETYNYSVKDGANPATLAGKWGLHFKGAAPKRLLTQTR